VATASSASKSPASAATVTNKALHSCSAPASSSAAAPAPATAPAPALGPVWAWPPSAPPAATAVDAKKDDLLSYCDPDENLAVVSFNLEIAELIKSEIMQVLPIKVAKDQVRYLMPESLPDEEEKETSFEESSKDQDKEVEIEDFQDQENGKSAEKEDYKGKNRNLDLILDVPLKVSVLLGKTKKPINDILGLSPGSIVELEKIADEPVDILVNGRLIAKGEVVVVNENFGVKITSILSAEDRVKNIAGR